MAAVSSGKLRHQVEIQDEVIGQDPVTGAPIVTWVPVSMVWAEVAPLSGREFVAAAAEQSEVRVRVTIRYREVTAKMRLVYRGKYYNILAVMEDAESGREHITLMCAEGVRLEQ